MHEFSLCSVAGLLCWLADAQEVLPQDFLHFNNLEAIKGYFRHEPHPLARTILDTFEKECHYTDSPISEGKRSPFIVVEGSNRAIRELIALKLSRKLNGRYLTNRAPCIGQYFNLLPQKSVLRRVFYLLSVYASVHNARVNLNMTRATILNGYWWEQVTYSLVQTLRGSPLPPATSDIFKQPEDLLAPDLIIFVDHPDTHNTLRQRTLDLYNIMSSRYPIMIQSMEHMFGLAVDDIYTNLRKNLSAYPNLRFSWRKPESNLELEGE